MNLYAPYQEPQSEAAKWNSAINIYYLNLKLYCLDPCERPLPLNTSDTEDINSEIEVIIITLLMIIQFLTDILFYGPEQINSCFRCPVSRAQR